MTLSFYQKMIHLKTLCDNRIYFNQNLVIRTSKSLGKPMVIPNHKESLMCVCWTVQAISRSMPYKNLVKSIWNAAEQLTTTVGQLKIQGFVTISFAPFRRHHLNSTASADDMVGSAWKMQLRTQRCARALSTA
jgi:hypothetical protein